MSPRRTRVLSGVALAIELVVLAAMLVPTLLGLKRYAIASGSMEPTIPVGSVVYNEIVPAADLAVGDIITFVPPPEYGIDLPVTHRIAAITTSPQGEQVFQTKGDANPTIDPWTFVLEREDQARVVRHLPYVGWFYLALGIPWVQLLVVWLPAVLIAAYVLRSLWRLAGDAVREETAGVPA